MPIGDILAWQDNDPVNDSLDGSIARERHSVCLLANVTESLGIAHASTHVLVQNVHSWLWRALALTLSRLGWGKGLDPRVFTVGIQVFIRPGICALCYKYG